MARLHVKSLPPCSGRTLIIGDVHGCAEEFATLLQAFSPSTHDRMVAVGDLVNRGPDSAAVLRTVREFGVQSVLGNHEMRLLQAWLGNNPDLLKPKDRETFAQLSGADWEWMASWPHVIRIPSLNTLIVHGGFTPGTHWREQDPNAVARIQVIDARGVPAKRSEAPSGRPWAEYWPGPEHVFYGHTPRPHPLFHPLATGLDTGCVYGYTLTAVSLPEREIFRVHARRPYVGS